jgi:hypothetical protein
MATMKTVQRYQTADGRVFNTELEAGAHETLVGRVCEIISALGSKCNISGGNGYIQHDPAIVTKIKDSFFKLALEEQGQSAKDMNIHWLGRYLSDSNSYLYGTWNRLECIDELGREFDQQFYRNNPHKCEMKEFTSC